MPVVSRVLQCNGKGGGPCVNVVLSDVRRQRQRTDGRKNTEMTHDRDVIMSHVYREDRGDDRGGGTVYRARL